MSKEIKSIELTLSGGNLIILNELVSKDFVKSINKDGTINTKAAVFNDNDGTTKEIIYTDHISFIKFNY